MRRAKIGESLARAKLTEHPRQQRRQVDQGVRQWRATAWQAAGVGAATKATGEDSAALRRIKADLPAREAVRKRLKFGMTIVTTDKPADAKTRSGDGFVVL
jgi:hypothetical protein